MFEWFKARKHREEQERQARYARLRFDALAQVGRTGPIDIPTPRDSPRTHVTGTAMSWDEWRAKREQELRNHEKPEEQPS